MLGGVPLRGHRYEASGAINAAPPTESVCRPKRAALTATAQRLTTADCLGMAFFATLARSEAVNCSMLWGICQVLTAGANIASQVRQPGVPFTPAVEARHDVAEGELGVEIDATTRCSSAISLEAAFALGGSMISAGLHGAVLIIFGCWILPALREPQRAAHLEASVSSMEDGRELTLAPQFDSAAQGMADDFARFVIEPEYSLPQPSVTLAAGLGARGDASTGQGEAHASPLPAISQGPGVRFFGSYARGSRFAFVLDASGSMNDGARFRRASAELLNSLDALGEDQQFHVLLFQNQGYAMLGQKPAQLQMLPATEENKEQLRYWLSAVQPQTWSDPREALQMALSLQPDAVFLLSDGEFKTGGRRVKKLGATTLRQVRHWNEANIPIHTIAYEDPINRRVLRALARASGGSYQYVPQKR